MNFKPENIELFCHLTVLYHYSQKGFQLDVSAASSKKLLRTFGAGEKCEESAGVAPAEPVPGLNETLVLRLWEEAGHEVGAQVGEAGGCHVPGDDHVGPVALAQRE